MDQIAMTSPAGDFGEHNVWRLAKVAVKALLRRASGDIRATSLRVLFEQGQALGWLTDILRGEIFSQGHYGNRAEPEELRLLTTEEFSGVLATMLRRYRETPATELMRVPQFLNLLYAWLQGGGTEEVRRWVQAQIVTDAGLLTFLSRARSWAANSNIGVYYPLKRRDLENFLDCDSVMRRLETIAANAIADPDRLLAAELLDAFNQNRDM